MFVFSVLSQDSPVKHPHKTHAILITPPPKKKKKLSLEAQHGICFNLSLKIQCVRKLMVESVDMFLFVQ